MSGHVMEVPEPIWRLAQMPSGKSKPTSLLREWLTEKAMELVTGADMPPPAPRAKTHGYYGPLIWPGPLRRPGSVCNLCGKEFVIGERVVGRYYLYETGSRVTRYFCLEHLTLPEPAK